MGDRASDNIMPPYITLYYCQGDERRMVFPIRPPSLPALLTTADKRASVRFRQFLAANIRNARTRRAYYWAAGEFLPWRPGARGGGVPALVREAAAHR